MKDENQDHAALGEGVDGDIHRFGTHRQHPYLRKMQPHGHAIACSGALNHVARQQIGESLTSHSSLAKVSISSRIAFSSTSLKADRIIARIALMPSQSYIPI